MPNGETEPRDPSDYIGFSRTTYYPGIIDCIRDEFVRLFTGCWDFRTKITVLVDRSNLLSVPHHRTLGDFLKLATRPERNQLVDDGQLDRSSILVTCIAVIIDFL